MNPLELPLPFVFHAASDFKEPGSAPLLIVLHGRGDSPAGFSWMPSTLNIERLNYLFLQAPDDYYGGYSWYDMAPNQLPGILRSRRLLEAILLKLNEAGFSYSNMLLFGFSQGCLMTLEFGARFPERLGGYLGISGYIYDPKALISESSERTKAGSWLVTHGTQDEVLPVERTREQIKTLIEAGFKIEYVEYSKSHTLDEQFELPKIRQWILERI